MKKRPTFRNSETLEQNWDTFKHSVCIHQPGRLGSFCNYLIAFLNTLRFSSCAFALNRPHSCWCAIFFPVRALALGASEARNATPGALAVRAHCRFDDTTMSTRAWLECSLDLGQKFVCLLNTTPNSAHVDRYWPRPSPHSQTWKTCSLLSCGVQRKHYHYSNARSSTGGRG